MKILVRGLEFQGFQGITSAERSVGHRFSLDITAVVPDAQEDSIFSTVDYGRMGAEAIALCNAHKDNLLETAVARIGKGLLARFPLIEAVTVRLVKLHPTLPLSFREVGVEMVFEREGN